MQIKTELPITGTYQEMLVGIVNHCVGKLARYHTFGYHTEDDISQQCWVITMEALNSGKYDNDRPLEKFLYRHLERRLKTFFRDEYFRKMRPDECKETWETRIRRKTSLMNSATEYDDDKPDTYSFEENIIRNDLSEYIAGNLPRNFRVVYLRVIADDLSGIPEDTLVEMRTLIREILLDA